MYYNKAIVIGFLGSDAEQWTTKNGASYTVLSLATKRSWKNDQGTYESRSYWHRAVAWGDEMTPKRKARQGGRVRETARSA